jgi:hypothetical protein
MQDTLKPTLIEKELISKLNFKDNFPLEELELEEQLELKNKLIEATKLGNSYRGKMRIEFFDDIGLKAVETTIWAAGAKFICLKGGVWIPISRIKKVTTL